MMDFMVEVIGCEGHTTITGNTTNEHDFDEFAQIMHYLRDHIHDVFFVNIVMARE